MLHGEIALWHICRGRCPYRTVAVVMCKQKRTRNARPYNPPLIRGEP